MWLLEHADITADYIKGRSCVRIQLLFKNKPIWIRELAMSANQIELREGGMTDEKFESTITNTMRSHLNLVAQMHFARLDQLFPNSIAEVTMGFDPTTNTKTLNVKFKNGHVADGPEAEAKGEFFLAKCAMLYDLPPI